MLTRNLNLTSSRRLALLAVAAMALAVTASVALADDLVQPDQRINQAAYFGGEALYCVNSDYEPTTNYGEMAGFRLLDISGQELLYIPSADVTTAVSQSQASGEGVEVGSGWGSYGPVSLVAYADTAYPDTITFTFNGTDEWGKPESLTFTNCFPVGPDVPESEDE